MTRVKCKKCNCIFTRTLQTPFIACPQCSFEHPNKHYSNSVLEEATRIITTPLPKFERHQDEPKDYGTLLCTTTEERFALQLGKNTIGRASTSSQATIQINDKEGFMSRQHFCIEVKIGSTDQCEYILSDLGTANGTLINKSVEPLSPYTELFIDDACFIKAGTVLFILQASKQVFDLPHYEEDEGTRVIELRPNQFNF